MTKKIALALAGIVLVFVLGEVFSLLRLRAHVARYADFWRHYPTTGTFTYVALGDSAAQGIGATQPQLGYVGLLASDIAHQTGKSVRIVNLSVSGAKVADVTRVQLPQLKNYKPDLVTLDIGGNDIVGFNATTFRQQYDQLAAGLPKGTLVANIPYFGGRVRKNAQALEASAIIAQAASKYGLHLVDLQTVTHQKQSIFDYAADYFHPSNRGYRNWRDAFWQTIQAQHLL